MSEPEPADADQVGAFVTSVVATLRELAGVGAAAREDAPAAGPDDVSAVIRLTADDGGEGYLVLGFPAATAAALAGRVLDGAAAADDAMVRDCAGELANVVAGQAKALLAGTPGHFTFSTPAVAAGPPAVPPGGWESVAFASDAGGFVLRVRRPG